MKRKAPGGAGQGRRVVKLKCEYCCFNSRNFQRYQALCRLIFLQALIGPNFEPVLSLRLDSALQAWEGGGPVHVGVVVRKQMKDIARRRIDPDYLGANLDG